MYNPLVSVIIPCYNAAPWIAQTIRSVLDQTYTNTEIVLVDDGSRDESASIVRSLKDERIHYHYKENSGVAETRNLGITLARGEVIAFLDADDVWEPTNLEKKVALLAAPDCDYSYCDLLVVDADLKPGYVITGSDANIAEDMLRWHSSPLPGISSNVTIKRSCLEDGSIRFDKTFSTAADQDFGIYLASRYRGRRVPEPLVLYRIVPGSMSKNMRVFEADHLGVFRKAEKMGIFQGRESLRKACFANLYYILGANWWGNGKDKIKGARYLLKAALTSPAIVTGRLRGKLAKRS